MKTRSLIKKAAALTCCSFMLFSFAACQSGTGSTGSSNNVSSKSSAAASKAAAKQSDTADPAKEEIKETAEPEAPASDNGKVLVAYFSCTGNTKNLAEYAAEITGGTLYEIVPAEPYSSADLDYGDSESRTSIEQNDKNCRPEISGSVDNFDGYGIVFLAYPIWWGKAPQILSTFVESYDFSGKTVIPFCTSGSSGIGSSAKNLQALTGGGNWLDGARHSSSMSKGEMEDWINGLGLEF